MTLRGSPEVLIDPDAIRRRVGELGRRISEEYARADNLHMVGVLRGSFIFLADLSRALTIPRSVDFLAVASYGAATASKGAVRLIADLRTDIAGKHVLIVEDIVDTGDTLDYLTRLLALRGPASLKCCALLSKPARRKTDVRIDYLGFEIPDVWVVGYGLDDRERYRALPYIGIPPGRRSA
ncbi:MAG TPA: hypoxanthine phosphoribosyltransferase [Candidatus Deferrimicrobium sp.]|nr:hypoxanthine phosphoribosyltransferase [Candidatus Deferrimicrobium sp.]